jgi:SprT-like family
MASLPSWAADDVLAMELQMREFEQEFVAESVGVVVDVEGERDTVGTDKSSPPAVCAVPKPPQGATTTLQLLDPDAELLDPTPDVFSLFLEYDKLFFAGCLASVELKWSSRMTLCAGLCSYQGKGGLCSMYGHVASEIGACTPFCRRLLHVDRVPRRLSQPLLKLRPRSDLVNTLLHEMIHAYLFITKRSRDRDVHGPDFQAHMDRINSAGEGHICCASEFSWILRDMESILVQLART